MTVSLVLLLQARGRTAARVLAAELDVSVRTVYRDLEALAAAGVPVVTESGPGGGCRLLDDYRFPLRGLRPDEAEALLILGVPAVFGELGMDAALARARRRIEVTAGVSGAKTKLVHLDMPRWFAGQEEVPISAPWPMPSGWAVWWRSATRARNDPGQPGRRVW
jgi:predicted DNA-binding transcriptional regulator YafY